MTSYSREVKDPRELTDVSAFVIDDDWREELPFEEAPDVQQIAARLISDFHEHLANANIKYIFKTDSWKKSGQVVLGQAHKCSGKERYLTGFDFIIMINGPEWKKLNDQQKAALVDHELLHCCGTGDDDNPFYVRPHSFEGFGQEIRRHGLWSADLVLVQKAVEEHRQLSYFRRSAGDS